MAEGKVEPENFHPNPTHQDAGWDSKVSNIFTLIDENYLRWLGEIEANNFIKLYNHTYEYHL